MKTKIIISFIISIVSLCILPELSAQNGRLIGLANNTLVEINPAFIIINLKSSDYSYPEFR